MIDNLDGQPDFYKEIFNLIRHQKLSHAYLIETKNVRNNEEIINKFVRLLYSSTQITFNENELNSFPIELKTIQNNGDYLEIKPNGSIIKKDQILEIQQLFKTKSLDNHYRIYVIYEADKLNKQAANSLLKFLEEPEENIIGILVSSNRYQILETVRSRCQIFSLKAQNSELEIENYDFILNFINTIELKKEETIAYLPDICNNEYYQKEKWTQIFYLLEFIYEQALRRKLDLSYHLELDPILAIIVSHNSQKQILYKISILEKQIKDLIYNLNINLMLDKFIIRFAGGEKNG